MCIEILPSEDLTVLPGSQLQSVRIGTLPPQVVDELRLVNLLAATYLPEYINYFELRATSLIPILTW